MTYRSWSKRVRKMHEGFDYTKTRKGDGNCSWTHHVSYKSDGTRVTLDKYDNPQPFKIGEIISCRVNHYTTVNFGNIYKVIDCYVSYKGWWIVRLVGPNGKRGSIGPLYARNFTPHMEEEMAEKSTMYYFVVMSLFKGSDFPDVNSMPQHFETLPEAKDYIEDQLRRRPNNRWVILQPVMVASIAPNVDYREL